MLALILWVIFIPSCKDPLYHLRGGYEANSKLYTRHFIMSCHPEQTVWQESSLALAFTLQSTCPGPQPNP